ncbi:unnamed protein product [Effrenium voratum]|nr:unnamed protein product [Effrenium voratum]
MGVATPGPAAYDTIHAAQSTKKRMPGFSMPGRYKEASETSPGPSDYGYYTTWHGRISFGHLLWAPKDASGPTLIFAHGLHERPTKSKAFAVAAVSRGFALAISRGMSDYDESSSSVSFKDVLSTGRLGSLLLFDARGHGQSSGWQGRGAEQFHWRCLGLDMLQVAHSLEQSVDSGLILGGCSMGAAAAVWAALLCPRAVKGLVLYLVPSMWATRQARRGVLEAKANTLTGPPKEVLLGAARADFPPREDLERLAPDLPVLIVTARDDPVHPASSADTLAQIFRHARVISDCKAGRGGGGRSECEGSPTFLFLTAPTGQHRVLPPPFKVEGLDTHPKTAIFWEDAPKEFGAPSVLTEHEQLNCSWYLFILRFRNNFGSTVLYLVLFD